MPTLDIKLLSGFHQTYDGVPVTTLNQPRMQSLLAYLLLHRNIPISRHYLAFVFWPDAEESQARNNLRQMLHQLRHALPDSERFFHTDVNTVLWLPATSCQLDVADFELAVARVAGLESGSDRSAMSEALQSAIRMYAGDLLPSCYDDWIAPERERLRSQYQRLLEQLLDLLEEQRGYATALAYAQRLLLLDPLREETYLSMMRLYAQSDNRAGALRTYNECAAILQRELGVEPGAAIQDFYKRLLRLDTTTSDQKGKRSLLSTAAVPLIGRQAEWEALRKTWQHAAAGHPTFALILGEAGIGKTRLAEEMHGWVRKEGVVTARTRAYEAEGRLAYSPVTDLLRSSTILPSLAHLDEVWRTETARLLPELITQFPNLPQPAPMIEYWQRQRFFEALARGVLGGTPPLLLLIDDLQWCDPETLEWLHFLLRFDAHAQLLVLGTARVEELDDNDALGSLLRSLQATNQISLCSLSPLNAPDTRQLAVSIANYQLDDTEAADLFRETEGNPLFVGEMVRAGIGSSLDSHPAPISALDHEVLRLPPRVYAVIAGRLAQLSVRARKVAELGAAVGRVFSFDLLCMAGQMDEEATVQALDELWQRRIIREQSANEFDFTHDKLRDVAYAEISIPQRRLLHRRIGQALESLHAHGLALVSGQIATQYEQAGMFEQALPYYQRASDVAASIYANDDAIELAKRGVALLLHLSTSAKRDSLELNLQLKLCRLYRITKGWASPEEEQAVDRAALLSEKVGDQNQRLHALFAMATMYIVQARYDDVEKAYAQIKKLPMHSQPTPPPDFAVLNIAGSRLFLGKPADAQALFDNVIASWDIAYSRDMQEILGYNYVVICLAWSAHALWCLGYPSAADEHANAAIELAQEVGQPFNHAIAITYRALMSEWCVEYDEFAARALEAYQRTTEYRALYYSAWANILVRFANSEHQPDADSVECLRDAINDFLKTGARVRLPFYLSLLARACYRAGQLYAALDTLEQAFTVSAQNNEHWWDAELHRLRGELRLTQEAPVDEVEADFQRALEIAHSQEARSLELRAATSLARLWQSQGKSSDAYSLLAPIYGWFTEGFSTPDLKAARTLLDQLES